MPFIKSIELKLAKRFNHWDLRLVFLVFTLFHLLVLGILGAIVDFIDTRFIDNPISELPKLAAFILGVILAPIIETWIYLYLLFEMGKRFKINDEYLFFVSCLLFGISHNYNPVYMIVMLIAGAVLAMAYLYVRNRSTVRIAFIFVTLMHALNNLLAFLTND